MRGILAMATVCAVLGSSAWLVAAETVVPPTNGSAAELVTVALKVELAGPSELRGRLLAEALRRDPDYAPARWHSGYVKFDGQWIKVDDVPRKARANESLAAYRKMRDGLIDTANNHRALARWCHKNHLLDEERIHWAKVLEFERNDEEAIAALGLQVFNGQLLTKSQIEAAKKQSASAQRAMREWQPKVVKWRKAIERGNAAQRDEASRELAKISDPAAIPALEVVLGTNNGSATSLELNKLLISVVGRMDGPLATKVLLRRAMLPESVEIRTAAAAELKKRPLHGYIPLLVALRPESFSVGFQYQISIMPTGAVIANVDAVSQGPNFEYRASFTYLVDYNLSSKMQHIDGIHFPGDSMEDARSRLAPLVRSLAHSTDLAAVKEQQNQVIRERIAFVLQHTVGRFGNDTDDLRQFWTDYNESYNEVSYGMPYYSTFEYYTEARFHHTQFSCFPAGTTVATMTGQKPIEQIKMSDSVLSQNGETGELTYRPVERLTIRPPVRLLKLAINDRTLEVTPGHPFWVVGHGWQIAKTLKPGDYLHSLSGPAMIESVDELPPVAAYNLVVSDLHSYFVGEDRLLVHDNLPIEESTSKVPGLKSQRVANLNQNPAVVVVEEGKR